MANFKEIKNELIQLGLTENQAHIYLLLVQHGELRIKALAQLTKLPRTSIYDNLNVLLGLGLVEKIVEDKFVKVKPYPVSAMRHDLNEKLLQLQTQMSKLGNLDKAISLLPRDEQPSATIVRHYKGVSGARQLIWNTLKAKETIYVYSAWGRGRYVGIKFYKSFVGESRQRGFKEKVLVNPTNRVLDSIRKYSGTSIGRTTPKDIRALDEKDILIKGETFIYGNIYAQLYLREEDIGGFEIESTNFTQMQKSIFETLWEIATPFSELL